MEQQAGQRAKGQTESDHDEDDADGLALVGDAEGKPKGKRVVRSDSAKARPGGWKNIRAQRL